MKLLAGVLAGWVSAQYPYYDYDQIYTGKSQADQSGGALFTGHTNSPEVASVARALGNGRICWSCLEESYANCLGANAVRGDAERHGAVYCQGEDYFCYISERRIIRHAENEWNYEQGAPWQTVSAVNHGELLNGAASGPTEVRVQMGCQQPLSCLRQQWQNYQIQIGVAFHQDNSTQVDAQYVPVGSQTEVRSGACRHHYAWNDHEDGTFTVDDEWRAFSWMEADTQSGNSKASAQGWGDRRFGATERHFQRGKGTESVCHYCCDPYLEYNAEGCNHVAAEGFVASGAGQIADFSGAVKDSNIFLKRPANDHSKDWSSNTNYPQYHGAFRNPHTQVAKGILA